MMTHFLYLSVFLPFTSGQVGGILGDLFGGGGNMWGQGRQSPEGWGQRWIPNGGENKPPPSQSPQGNNPLDMIGQGVKDMLNQVGVGKLAAGLTGSSNGRDILQDFRVCKIREKSTFAMKIQGLQYKLINSFFLLRKSFRGGQVPLFNDVQNILTTIAKEGVKYLPKIPRIFIKDPLSGVNQELANVVREFATGLGMISPQISGAIKLLYRIYVEVSNVFNFEKSVLGKDTTDNINLRFDRTLQVKQALLEKANLHNELWAFLYWPSGPCQPSLSKFSVWKCRWNEGIWKILIINRGMYKELEIVGDKKKAETRKKMMEEQNKVNDGKSGRARGIALHETLHALGLNHQHLRMDRDQHITVDWSNINPQHYDYFVVADSKLYTTYGVKYDYGSIMHYNAYTGAVNIAKPTMIPKVNQIENLGKLGQRNGMSVADVEIVKKMYCMPGKLEKNNILYQ
uniref:Metalloendopeptidase n=1 Tax=Heterorhabditis bacteriophora TaxID=37862 RepID=A0A1I7X9Z1_HETBA